MLTIPLKNGIQFILNNDHILGINKVTMDSYYVYILASKRNGTLYTGMTSDLIQRVYTHKNDFADGFTKRYGVHMLVYFEQWEDREGALKREKQIKEWKRKWKLELIEKNNPEWNDLYDQIISS